MKHLWIAAIVLLLTFAFSCNSSSDDDSETQLPALRESSSGDLIEITNTTAVFKSTISSDGGSPITQRGVVWNTAENPTTANNKTTDGSGTGNFTSNITGLIPNTKYYLRAYAINSNGITYGNQLNFNTTSVPKKFDITLEAVHTDTIDTPGYQTCVIFGVAKIPTESNAKSYSVKAMNTGISFIDGKIWNFDADDPNPPGKFIGYGLPRGKLSNSIYPMAITTLRSGSGPISSEPHDPTIPLAGKVEVTINY
ncbi:MAG: fibronectin type III domain-containing protein [Bergeyella sp.]